ncbi:MAG: hypothetical protein C0506_05445 [Anaerolinea sp.]|nr:hypothetical protein [Anaerolinea sp.]
MNALRRTLLVVYSLLVIAAAGGLIGLAWNQDRKLDLSIGELNLQAFITSDDNAKYAFTAICAAVALFGLFTLVAAVLRPAQGRSSGTLRMRQADGGTVEVTATAIENLLREEFETYPEVRNVRTLVRLNSGAVETHLDAVIEPSASIASVTAVLGQGVASVLRDQVGVTNVKRPTIKITYDESVARPVGGPARQSGAARPIMREETGPPPTARDDGPRADE